MKNKVFITAILCCCIISTAFSQSQELETGDKAPEINLPSPDGDSVALSDLSGKLVLIDFWATWCAPCIKEQPELAKLYRKYKNSVFANGNGFEIYGVSLDNKKALWESSIKKMRIEWIQVSDLKFWTSPVAKTYNIQALPFNILIDGKGIIIAKNLHGTELEVFIHNLLIGSEKKFENN
jgi:thiol-disulfide isomerase/thioredoxin